MALVPEAQMNSTSQRPSLCHEFLCRGMGRKGLSADPSSEGLRASKSNTSVSSALMTRNNFLV